MSNAFQYCFCFDGERECPWPWKNRLFERLAWEAEREACRSCWSSPSQQLFFVAEYIGSSLRGGSGMLAARYIAEFPFCDGSEKRDIAVRLGLDHLLFFVIPRGWTLFESRWEREDYRFGGQILYRDGRLFHLIGGRFPKGSSSYLLLGKNRDLSDEVRFLMKENWAKVETIPDREEGESVYSGMRYSFKFLGKRCEGYSMEKPLRNWNLHRLHRRINRLFAKYGYLIGEDSPFAELENFVAKWSCFMDEIMSDRTRRKFFEFLEMDFGKECASLGFVMDEGEGFVSRYGELFRRKYDNYEEAFRKVQDFQLLGNEIYSGWSCLTRLGMIPEREFDPLWFKAALDRLEQLGLSLEY